MKQEEKKKKKTSSEVQILLGIITHGLKSANQNLKTNSAQCHFIDYYVCIRCMFAQPAGFSHWHFTVRDKSLQVTSVYFRFR